MKLLYIIIVVLFTSCVPAIDPYPPEPTGREITFAEISQPYLDRYGQPEDADTYTSGNYMVTDWWWWTQGFNVTFSNNEYDSVNGWTVSSTFSFTPIN